MATTPALPADYYQSATPVVTDWGYLVKFTPSAYLVPSDIPSLIAAIQAYLARPAPRGTLRFLGGLHSCTDIFEGDTVIDTSQMPKTIVYDAGNGACVVTGNWHLHAFLAEVATRGKSLSATGGTDAQMLAGLISTNTAGATMFASIYELVDWVEYLAIAADGHTIETRTIAATDAGFAAIICSLGVLGYITRIRFRLVDEIYMTSTQEIVKIDPIINDPYAMSKIHKFWRVEWIPDTDEGLLWSADPINKERADPDGDYPPDGTEVLMRTVINWLEAHADSGPYLDWQLKAAYEIAAKFYTPIHVTGPMRNILPVDRLAPLRVAQAEWCFDPADLSKAVALMRAYFGANKWPNITIEIELTRTDHYHMSAWNWPGIPAVAKFNLQYLTDGQSPENRALMMAHLQGLWHAIQASGLKFKAHWGKLNFMDTAFVAANFELEAFKPYVQPALMNDYLRARLGNL